MGFNMQESEQNVLSTCFALMEFGVKAVALCHPFYLNFKVLHWSFNR